MLYQTSIYLQEIHMQAPGNVVLSWPLPFQGGTALWP